VVRFFGLRACPKFESGIRPHSTERKPTADAAEKHVRFDEYLHRYLWLERNPEYFAIGQRMFEGNPAVAVYALSAHKCEVDDQT